LAFAYTLVPLAAGFYFAGTGFHDDRFRETGLIGFETLIDANLVVEAVKLAADRSRPLESDGRGHFGNSPNGRWNSSFPSGHAINVWALASVVAHQYPHPRIVPVIVYGLASTVVAARVGARQHFPGDVVAGSAMGWFIWRLRVWQAAQSRPGREAYCGPENSGSRSHRWGIALMVAGTDSSRLLHSARCLENYAVT
jgi:membrane-associated phospholipid phosphatase